MGVQEKIRDGFMRNPLAWFLFAALILATYGNYQRGKELSRVCDLLSLDAAITTSGTAKDEIANICAARDDDSN